MPRGKELTEYEKGQIDARREPIRTAWDQLSLQTLRNHVDSMPNRIFQVVNRNGECTGYY